MPIVYQGSSRRLVIAFDVGTTYSGISYCILNPGDVPKVHSVTHFPGQENASGTTKIPSVLMYDHAGNLRAAGAEASLDGNVLKAEAEGWVKAEWFKLRLRPKSMPAKLQTSTLPPLPVNKSVVAVFADLLAYLMHCAERFIPNTHPPHSAPFEQSSRKGRKNATAPDGSPWTTLRSKAEFVIGHPNGWEGPQQAKIREAAVLARLVPDTAEGMNRLRFVTEGEASLCYCLGERVGESQWANSRQPGFIIADLGGGTLDFSAYRITGTKPLQVEEIAANKCEAEGSTFVTLRAKGYIKHKLSASSSPYASDEHVSLVASRFDETIKRTFRSAEDTCLVPFGSLFDNDPANGIVKGKLKLSGHEVATFFEPAVAAAEKTINSLIKESSVPISAVYLVGGFSASPYVLSQLRQRLDSVRVSVPDNQTVKAVAEGAVRFYIYNYVVARVAKFTYGVIGNRAFKPEDPEHLKRVDRCYTTTRGKVELRGAFHCILKKGTIVSRETEFEKALIRDYTSLENLSKAHLRIWAYRGEGPVPEWIDDRKLTRELCSVVFDLSSLRDSLRPRKSANGTLYWRVQYTVTLLFGSTELRAQCKWMVDGREQRSSAAILYDDAAEVADDIDDGGDGDIADETAHICGRMQLVDLS